MAGFVERAAPAPPPAADAGGEPDRDKSPLALGAVDRRAQVFAGTGKSKRISSCSRTPSPGIAASCLATRAGPITTTRSTQSKPGGAFGVAALFRMRDAKNYYVFDLAGWQNRKYAVECFVDGRHNWVTHERAGAMAAKRTYRVLVKARGDHFLCYIDGVLIYDFHDKWQARSGVGFRCWGGAVRLSSIRVDPPRTADYSGRGRRRCQSPPATRSLHVRADFVSFSCLAGFRENSFF